MRRYVNYDLQVGQQISRASPTRFRPLGLLIGFLLLGAAGRAWAQSTFQEKGITESKTCDAKDVHAADLTGNGALDVLSASEDDNKIAWYENNGDGTFSNQKVIITDAIGAQSVHAADLTGNGSLDPLSISDIDDKVAWYKNQRDDEKQRER